MANATMRKFGFPDTLVREFDHWVVLVRPAQVTLGSLVLAAKSDATALSALPPEAFAELGIAITAVENALRAFSSYERINYLALMMVDPNAHFHVVPRYSAPRNWNFMDFPDQGWPGPPNLKLVIDLDANMVKSLLTDLKPLF